MFASGTLINTVAVIGGGLLGLFFKKGLKESFQDIMMKASGIAVLFIGMSGTLKYMLVIDHNAIETRGTMLLIFSLLIGALLGEIAGIEDGVERIGERLKRLVHSEKDTTFVDGFVNTSLIICIGAMAIVGAIQDGLNGDPSTLVAKAVLDAMIVMVNTSIYGKGTIFSAIPIFIYQGAITVIAALCGSFIHPELIEQLSFVGSALIFCVGINTTFGKIIKVGNMLPALLIPIGVEVIGAIL
ncbi:MAG: DUF554 domain-containing protein [Hespellia sp.]|jgi:uncharacterized membrane protein YqgA involved in biofilm formation|nr:DUF554 domain-containing protein [Hespellia sp.]